MCLRPITITRYYPGVGTKQNTVPCGKCDECTLRKQGDFASLAVMECMKYNCVHFVTLTYSNRAVPVMLTEKESRLQTFASGPARNFFLSLCSDSTGTLFASSYKDLDVCPSLRREDVRLFMKRVRIRYKRLFGLDANFAYAGFGEYGGRTFRPHYHFLFYGASDKFVSFLADEWQKDFGFPDVKKVRCINQDGSPGYVKVSKYISKYVAKDKSYFPWIIDGLVEPP